MNNNIFGKNLLESNNVIFVPDDYDPDSWIDNFVKEKNKKSLNYINPNLKSCNFKGVSHKPVPGNDYGVGMVPLLNSASGQEIVDCMEKIPGICFFGVQGGLLLQKHKPEFFSEKYQNYSFFDKRNNLYRDQDKIPGTLFLINPSSEEITFHLASFDGPWPVGSVVVYFYEL